jgi:chromosomal replication initiation ATPase DnaA
MGTMTERMTERSAMGQLTLDLPRTPVLTREDVLASPANAAALALVDAWPEWPSTVNVLLGAPGTGKSLLARLWAEKAQASKRDLAAIAPLAEAEMAIVVDDEPAANTLDQVGLFHLINALKARGGHVLIATSTPPAEWPVDLADLKSRLAAATIAALALPDDSLLEAVIAKGFSDRQLTVDHDVVAFLAKRIDRSLNAATEIVDLLDAESMARQARLTRSFAAQFLRRNRKPDQPDFFE